MTINRQLYPELIKHLDKKEYTIITGARQVGKTTLIRMMYNELTNAEEEVFYLSFENPSILQKVNEHPENIFLYAKKPENIILSAKKPQQKRVFVIIDEVQYADNPSNLLKYLYDTYEGNLKIIATGSSAFYMDKKFEDSLAGRKRIFNLKPLNFNEFLFFKNAHNLIEELELIQSQSNYVSAYHNDLIYFYNEYLTYGGYPRVVLENNNKEKLQILNEIAHSFIKKDVYESNIEYEHKFFQLITLLADQTGNLLNKNELANTLRLNSRTIERYIYILQKCFHIDLVSPFYTNMRKEITKMPKIYFNDLGLRNIVLNRFGIVPERADKGQIFENAVYIRLKELYDTGLRNIKYWRTSQGNEVDFIIPESLKKGIAYEVKFKGTEFSHKMYKSFTAQYPDFLLSGISYVNEKDCISVFKI